MQFMDRWRASSRRQKLLVIAALVYLSYALAGYFLLSPLIHKRLVDELATLTGREVTLGDFTFNPLGLAVTATDFRLLDEDGTEFVAFDRLYVDFELSSLLRWSWYFDVIELDRPRIQVTQTGLKSFNFDDLVAGDGTESQAGEDEGAASLPALSIGELVLAEGDFRFRDLSRSEPRSLVLDQLSFEVLDFSTRSDGEDGNQYALTITSPEGGRFEWTGRMVLEPLLLEGQLSLSGLELPQFAEFYSDRLRFEVPEGELEIATGYRIKGSEDSTTVELSGGSVVLNELRVRERGREEDALSLPAIELEGIALSTAEQRLSAERLHLDSPFVLARQTNAGLDLATLFTLQPTADDSEEAPLLSAAAEAGDQEDVAQGASAAPAGEESDQITSEAPAQASEAEGAAWKLALGELSLSGGNLRYRDETLAQPAELGLTPLDFNVTELHWGEPGEFRFDLQTAVDNQGALSVTGTGTPAPLAVSAELAVADLPLALGQPWLQDRARVQLLDGVAATEWQLDVNDQGDPVQVTGSGSLQVDNLDLQEGTGSPLLRFAGLGVEDISLDLAGRDLSVAEVLLDTPVFNSAVDEQGQHVADRVVVPVPAPVTVGESPVWHYAIDRVRVRDGELLFADRSLQPDFTIGLYQINSELTGIDTRSDQASKLTLETQVDRYAPLSANGGLKLATDKPFADVIVTLQNYEMASLTPYTGRYVGYTVSQGLLGLNTELVLEGTVLDSVTDLQADSFYLGDKVESDEAIKAPIKLGLAVLRDKQGMIRLPIKASGDLSDPSVSVSGIILKALGNVLVKAATSPFSVLAGLAGGESLENLAFQPGSAELDDALRQDLQKLASLLADRPMLDLKLAGAWSDADRNALAQAQLVDRFWRSTDWPGLEQGLEDERFRRRLVRAYGELTGEDAEAMVPPADTEEGQEPRAREVARLAWDALLKDTVDAVPETQLDELAARRADNVKAALVEELGVDGGRLFLQSGSLADREPVAGVQLGLDVR